MWILWPWYPIYRGLCRVVIELYDVIEFHGSRWRARRRLPRARLTKRSGQLDE
jgi:hypothetical protein